MVVFFVAPEVVLTAAACVLSTIGDLLFVGGVHGHVCLCRPTHKDGEVLCGLRRAVDAGLALRLARGRQRTRLGLRLRASGAHPRA